MYRDIPLQTLHFNFGSPLFDKITIQLDDNYYSGRELVLETKNQHPDNLYVQSLTFNGEAITKNWMYRNELMQGGTLVFELGTQPNIEWGIETPPPSMSNEK